MILQIAIAVGSIVAALAVFFFLIRMKKKEPLTYLSYFFPDAGNDRYIHIAGAIRHMPDEGESFDVFYHLLFDTRQMQFLSGGQQRGKDIELSSPFMQRTLAALSGITGAQLSLRAADKDEDEDQASGAIFHIHRFEAEQSDTENISPVEPDSLVFIDQGSGERFRLLVYRNGAERAAHTFQGNGDYFFFSAYLHSQKWFLFTYRKTKGITGGMALCILQYETGSIVYDGFIRPGQPGKSR